MVTVYHFASFPKKTWPAPINSATTALSKVYLAKMKNVLKGISKQVEKAAREISKCRGGSSSTPDGLSAALGFFAIQFFFRSGSDPVIEVGGIGRQRMPG